MFRKPSPIAQKLVKDVIALRKQIAEIQEKIEDPELFEQLNKKNKTRP